MNPIIEVSDLSKQYHIGSKESYKTFRETLTNVVTSPARLFRKNQTAKDSTLWALKDVSFEVREGDVLGIIGRNGAGKTTLLKIFSRVTAPTEGYVKLRGRVATLLEVGTGFHPELTGRENIYLNGAILGMTRAEINRKFDEIVAFAGTEKFLDTPVKRYSSGMYVRLAFAVAAHLEPEILIVDEVLAVGDAQFQKKCLGKMGEVAKQGRTVLFVSHNMPAVRTLCSRAILLDKGTLQKDGATSEVVSYYLDSGSFSASRGSWSGKERPGSRSFRLNSVALQDSSGIAISSVNISEDAVVEISYEVIEAGAQAGFSLILFDQEGACVFSSLSNTESNYYGKPLSRGYYKSRCCIYKNLLNAGKFSVKIIGFSASWSDPFVVENAISFDAVDDGVLKKDFYGDYSGSVRPLLEWSTERITT